MECACLSYNGATDSAPVPLYASHYRYVSLSDRAEYLVVISRLFARLFLFIPAKSQTVVHSLDTAAPCRPLFTLSILRRLAAPCSLSRYCGVLSPHYTATGAPNNEVVLLSSQAAQKDLRQTTWSTTNST